MDNDDLDQNGMEMENPIDQRWLSVFSMLVTCAFVMGLFTYGDSAAHFYGSILFFIIGSVWALILVYTIFIHQPTGVIIGKNGIVLRFRFRSPREYAWDDIESVDASEDHARGNFKIKRENACYPVVTAIGMEMREAYMRSVGKYPPTYSNRKI